MTTSSCTIDVLFRVEINFDKYKYINRSSPLLVVGLVGNIEEFGNWKPQNSILLDRNSINHNNQQSADKSEVWSVTVHLTQYSPQITYRFFIGELAENSDDLRQIKILNWESAYKPRTLSLQNPLDSSNGALETHLSKYGSISSVDHVLRGWLTVQTALHLRLHSKAVTLFKQRHIDRRLFITCRRYMFRSDEDTEIDSDADDAAPVRRWSIDLPSTNPGAPSITESNDLAMYTILRAGQLQPAFSPETQADNTRGQVGVEYSHDDYLTFLLETSDLDLTAVEFEFWVEAGTSSNTAAAMSGAESETGPGKQSIASLGESSESTGTVLRGFRPVGTARLGPFADSRGLGRSQILDRRKTPIGNIKVDYLVIHPLEGVTCNMETSYQSHWKPRAPLHVGHRGFGSTYAESGGQSGETTPLERSLNSNEEGPLLSSSPGSALVKENTLEAFNAATRHGADFVELDVHLTKDHHVVVYHDFKVAITLRKKRRGHLQYHQIAVRDLNFKELESLKISHASVLDQNHSDEKLDEEDLDSLESQAFPELRKCFESTDPHLGFDVEIKYPMTMRSGESEQANYFDLNFFLDTILAEIFTHAGSRRIILSCFDPDVCSILQLKQNKYPVVQLGMWPDYTDPRHSKLELIYCHVTSFQLLGFALSWEDVQSEADLMKQALNEGKIILVWGDSGNCSLKRKEISGFGVQGIIYDRLHEYKDPGSLNVFQSELALKVAVDTLDDFSSDASSCASCYDEKVSLNGV